MKKLILVLVGGCFVFSCGKTDSKNLEEKVQRELVVTNENLDKRALALENDLTLKQLFFSSLNGTFEGNLQVGEKVFKTRITFIPSLPPYTSTRIRTAEEIVSDLNNLFFSVQTTHWNSKGSAVAAGCIFGQIRPDYQNGQVNISGESCSNVYNVNMFNSELENRTNLDIANILEISKEISRKVLRGEIRQVDEIFLTIQPTLLAKTFLAKLKRVNP